MFHIVNYATDLGIGSAVASSILSLVGIGSLFGRLLIGGLTDIFNLKRILQLCFFSMTILLFGLIFIRKMLLFYIFGILFGLVYGGVVPLQAMLVNRIFGNKSIGAIFGFVVFFLLLLGGTGPLVAGYLFDITGSYYYAFITSALLVGIAMIVSQVIKVPGKLAFSSS
jgi:MFS family permease